VEAGPCCSPVIGIRKENTNNTKEKLEACNMQLSFSHCVNSLTMTSRQLCVFVLA
jgi:hypothetical protein